MTEQNLNYFQMSISSLVLGGHHFTGETLAQKVFCPQMDIKTQSRRRGEGGQKVSRCI